MSNRLVLLVVASAIACSDAAGTEVASPVGGAWHYSGSQDSPTVAQLSGSLSWRGVSSAPGAFEGTYSIVEVAVGGQQRTLAGASAGQLAADTIADFDIDVFGAARHHLGILRGDSISGMWTELGSNAASGRFVLRRNMAAIR